MKTVGRMLTTILTCTLMLTFLLFGNLSIYYGSGPAWSEAWKLHMAMQFQFPRMQEKPPNQAWPEHLFVTFHQCLLHAFGEPASSMSGKPSSARLSLNGFFARLNDMIHIEKKRPPGISSQYSRSEKQAREKIVDMKRSKAKKTN